MAEKLSESLTKLAAKTKSIEDRVRKAHEESKEKLDKKIEESKADLQIKKDSFITNADFVLKKFTPGKKLEEKKHEWDLASAVRHYNESVDYAKSCIEWAMIALAEVEISTLEAFASRLEVENLKETSK
jgi:hypothetical protein